MIYKVVPYGSAWRAVGIWNGQIVKRYYTHNRSKALEKIEYWKENV
jgi:hypothetical protein